MSIFNQKSKRETRVENKSVRRYAEGWEVRTELGPDGKIKKYSVYTGTMYHAEETKKQHVLRCVLYVLALAAAVALFLFVASRGVAANRRGIVPVGQAGTLVFCGWLLVSLISYATNPLEMVVYDYKSGPGALRKASLGAAVSAVGTAVLLIVFVILHEEDRSEELLSVPGYLVSAALLYGIHLAEKKLVYSTYENKPDLPDAAYAPGEEPRGEAEALPDADAPDGAPEEK